MLEPRIESIINEEGRIIVIGDLHGCYREAQTMLDELSITDDDVVIFAGDLIDRGEHSGKCVDLAMKHRAIVGNHEEKCLMYHHQIRDGSRRETDPMPQKHRATRDQLREEHYSWMEQLPHIIRLPQHRSAVVHAGAFVGLPLEQQTIRHLLHIQCVNPALGNDHTYWFSKRPTTHPGNSFEVVPDESYQFWTAFWKGPERLIFGHSVLNQPLILEHAVGIDGGCCFGHELWAWVLPDERIHRVKSMQLNSSSWIGHTIHGDVRTF